MNLDPFYNGCQRQRGVLTDVREIFVAKDTELAVIPSKRSELLPDVPTLKELGLDIDISLWYGVFVRSETPQPIV